MSVGTSCAGSKRARTEDPPSWIFGWDVEPGNACKAADYLRARKRGTKGAVNKEWATEILVPDTENEQTTCVIARRDKNTKHPWVYAHFVCVQLYGQTRWADGVQWPVPDMPVADWRAVLAERQKGSRVWSGTHADGSNVLLQWKKNNEERYHQT